MPTAAGNSGLTTEPFGRMESTGLRIPELRKIAGSSSRITYMYETMMMACRPLPPVGMFSDELSCGSDSEKSNRISSPFTTSRTAMRQGWPPTASSSV